MTVLQSCDIECWQNKLGQIKLVGYIMQEENPFFNFINF